jgi:hypothetical protein
MMYSKWALSIQRVVHDSLKRITWLKFVASSPVATRLLLVCTIQLVVRDLLTINSHPSYADLGYD